MINKNILNRVEISILENDSQQVYSMFQDWLKLTEMKETINLMPNVVEFDFIPGYTFYGLKPAKPQEVNEHPLTFNFVCDSWETYEL